MAQGIFGINSSFDSAALIDNLVELNRRPIDLNLAKRELEDQKLTSFLDLTDRLKTFKSVLTTINTESRFKATKGVFNNSVSTATTEVVDIVTNSSATSGTFSFTVNQLANETKLITDGFASINNLIPQGNLAITVGSTVTNVSIDASNNTLAGLRLAINNSGADVQANFLDDGSSLPSHLTISGTKTGTDNAVSMSMTIDLIGSGTVNLMGFTETQAAQDASVTVDGVSVTSSSNTLTDVIPNSVLTLLGTGDGTLTISSDLTTIKEQVQDFVDGFNDVMGHLNDQLALDEGTGTTSLLFGNFMVQNLQSNLRNLVTSSVTGVSGSFSYLSQIGIRTQDDGLLSIDDGQLDDALASDIDNVSQLFSSKGTTDNIALTFVGFTEDTQPGNFDIRVLNGVPQVSVAGANDFTDAVGSGNFFTGADGTAGEGLSFRISSTTVDGSFGSITLAVGVAELLNREVADLTDFSRNGPLDSEIDSATDTIDDLDDTIDEQEERLILFEEDLRERFSTLEVLLGQLDSQKQAFNSALDGLKAVSS